MIHMIQRTLFFHFVHKQHFGENNCFGRIVFGIADESTVVLLEPKNKHSEGCKDSLSNQCKKLENVNAMFILSIFQIHLCIDSHRPKQFDLINDCIRCDKFVNSAQTNKYIMVKSQMQHTPSSRLRYRHVGYPESIPSDQTTQPTQ